MQRHRRALSQTIDHNVMTAVECRAFISSAGTIMQWRLAFDQTIPFAPGDKDFATGPPTIHASANLGWFSRSILMMPDVVTVCSLGPDESTLILTRLCLIQCDNQFRTESGNVKSNMPCQASLLLPISLNYKTIITLQSIKKKSENSILKCSCQLRV